jgi:ferrous-iron efflux pump FieF
MESATHNARLLRLATTWSVATAGLLIVVKFGAWIETGAVSLLASLIDSLMDVAASIINLVAVRYSLRPADEEHRFGHGKAESLAALTQAAFITGSALLLSFQAVDRLIHPRAIEQPLIGVWVMVFAIVATIVLLGVQRHVVEKTGSLAIKADSVHYKTDLLTNIATIAAIMLAVVGWTQADALFGLGIAVYILWSAFHIGFGAAQHLMDHELPEDAQQKIIDIVLTHPEVRGVHELRTRQSGQTPFIQLHIELDGNMRLSQAHHIGDDVELMIKKAMPGADVLIHQDADDDSPPDHPGGRVQPSGASRPYSDAGVDLSEEKKSRED